VHLFYLDDSRDEQLCIFTALAIPVPAWRRCLDMLKEFRRSIRRSHGVFVHRELHAWKLVSGRGRIADRIVTKYERSRIFRDFLSTVAALPGASVFNACFSKKDDMIALERLLNRINRTLRTWNSHGIIISDEGKELEYTRLVRKMGVFNPIPSMFGRWKETGEAYKNIPIDRIVEDPFFKRSQQSYFVQAADCVAYALLRRERPVPSKTRYGIHEAFRLLSKVLFREASRRDPEGIIRP